MENRAPRDANFGPHHTKGADARAVLNLRCGVHDGAGVRPGFGARNVRGKQPDNPVERGLGIPAAQEGQVLALDAHIFSQNDGTGPGRLKGFCVTRIGQKAHLPAVRPGQ